jgi:hypothetical protein
VQIKITYPAPARHQVPEHVPLSRVVSTGKVEGTELGDWETADTGFSSGSGDAIGEYLDRSVRADDLVIRPRAAGVSEQSPVAIDQRDIGFAVSAVHREDGSRHAGHLR